jgi:mRNA interferase MazF
MIYNKYDIVTVPFPFTESSSIKNRPALIISTKKYQSFSNHCILCMITSTKHTSWDNDIEIINLKETGLSTTSKIRFKVFSLPVDLINSKIGVLGNQETLLVKSKIAEIL